jgi:hypothetical protein
MDGYGDGTVTDVVVGGDGCSDVRNMSAHIPVVETVLVGNESHDTEEEDDRTKTVMRRTVVMSHPHVQSVGRM